MTMWLAGTVGTVGTAVFLSGQLIGYCFIACTATACLLLLVYVFGPDKQSNRIARLLRLPDGIQHGREIGSHIKKS
jgi:hypothetical protein